MPGTISRRSAVGILGAGVLAGALVARYAGSTALAAFTGADDALGPVRVGTKFARWTIVKVNPVEDGVLSLTVRGQDGHDFELELMARDNSPLAPRPPAETAALAIYVRNGGDGWAPTMEEQGLCAMTLAQVLTSHGSGGPIAGLTTHSDRLVLHGESLMGDGTYLAGADLPARESA